MKVTVPDVYKDWSIFIQTFPISGLHDWLHPLHILSMNECGCSVMTALKNVAIVWCHIHCLLRTLIATLTCKHWVEKYRWPSRGSIKQRTLEERLQSRYDQEELFFSVSRKTSKKKEGRKKKKTGSEVWILTLHKGVKNVSTLSSAVKHSFTHWTNQSLPPAIMGTTVTEPSYRMHRLYCVAYRLATGAEEQRWQQVLSVCMCRCMCAGCFKKNWRKKSHREKK